MKSPAPSDSPGTLPVNHEGSRAAASSGPAAGGAASAHPPRAVLARRLSRSPTPWVLLWPSLVLSFVLFVLPQASLLGYSLRPDPQSEQRGITLENFSRFFGDPFYLRILGRTLLMGLEVTAICLVLGFPLAYWLARMESRWRGVFLTLTVFPLLTSAVVRSFGWMVILYRSGLVDQVFLGLGLTDQPLGLMYSLSGVVIALAEVLMPFMVLTLYSVIQSIDRNLEEASMNLGAGPVTTLFRVILPLSAGGILSGSLLVFSLAISSFVTPSLVGGARVQLMATLIQEQAITLVNWQFAAAVATILLLVVLTLATAYSRMIERTTTPAGQMSA